MHRHKHESYRKLSYEVITILDLMTFKNEFLIFCMRKVLVSYFPIFFFALAPMISNSQEQRNLLQQQLQAHPIATWEGIHLKSFNSDSISKKLNELPENLKEKIKEEGKAALSYDWPVIPATSYLEFVRSGDRGVMEHYYRKRNEVLKSLILAELMERNSEYLDAIINGSWALCEQSSWVLSAHLPLQKAGAGIPDVKEPVLDLGAGEIAANLGWVYHLFGAELEKNSPLLNLRIATEIDKKIIQPYVQRDDFWWMGFKEHAFVNNWNPWVNYNVALSTVLLGDTVKADIKENVLAKTMRSVDNFINYYKQDGASEEGPNYWSHAGGKLLEYLEFLKNISDGYINLGNEQLIQNIGTYIMDVHIDDQFYVNFADSSVRVKPNPALIYRYGLYIDNQELVKFASFVAKSTQFFDNPIIGSLNYSLHNLQVYERLQEVILGKNNKLLSWFNETGLVTARTNKDGEKGFFFAAKGGHNDESHNHNDVGSFVLYHQGKPLLIDVGVETYSAKTFSKDRYDIWAMQSDYHNLPIINNTSQAYGKKFKAQDVSMKNRGSSLMFSLEICGAYPKAAQCKEWVRSFTLKRKQPELIIKDVVQFNEIKGPAIHNFMLALPPKLLEQGKILLKQGDGTQVVFYYPSAKFDYDFEEIVLEDKKLKNDWQQDKLYRLVLTSKNVDQLQETSSFRVIEEH